MTGSISQCANLLQTGRYLKIILLSLKLYTTSSETRNSSVAAEKEEVDTKASDGTRNLYVGLFTAVDGYSVKSSPFHPVLLRSSSDLMSDTYLGSKIFG